MKNALNKICLALIGLVSLCVALIELASGINSGTSWLIFTLCGVGVGVIQAIEHATKKIAASIEGLSDE